MAGSLWLYAEDLLKDSSFNYLSRKRERMHEHKECEHDLKYCSKCDVVYCIKCGKEWNSHTVTVSTPFITYPSTTWVGNVNNLDVRLVDYTKQFEI